MIYVFILLCQWIIRPTVHSTYNIQHLTNTNFKHIHTHSYSNNFPSLNDLFLFGIFAFDFNGFLGQLKLRYSDGNANEFV
jgi:hypothetical protein